MFSGVNGLTHRSLWSKSPPFSLWRLLSSKFIAENISLLLKQPKNNYCETHGTVNTRNISECYCVARNRPIRCEITKPQTATVINLWFWGFLAYPELYCNWPVHNQHSRNFSGVHGFLSLTVNSPSFSLFCLVALSFLGNCYHQPNIINIYLRKIKDQNMIRDPLKKFMCNAALCFARDYCWDIFFCCC